MPIHPDAPQPVAWFHGVSVGEIHLLSQVVQAFRQQHPDWICAVSTTTDTGFEEAKKRFPGTSVFYWPLDFSWAVRRALASVRPALVVLAEGEMWPNFLRQVHRQGVKVAVINGRMSPRSFRRHCRFRRVAMQLFQGVDLFAVQTAAYAACFRALGVEQERVAVTGSVKYDGVTMDRQNARTKEMAKLFGIGKNDLVFVAGSTQDPEEEIALAAWEACRADNPTLRLILVPRQRIRTVAKFWPIETSRSCGGAKEILKETDKIIWSIPSANWEPSGAGPNCRKSGWTPWRTEHDQAAYGAPSFRSTCVEFSGDRHALLDARPLFRWLTRGTGARRPGVAGRSFGRARLGTKTQELVKVNRALARTLPVSTLIQAPISAHERAA